MRINTIKKNVRSNQTIRWGGVIMIPQITALKPLHSNSTRLFACVRSVAGSVLAAAYYDTSGISTVVDFTATRHRNLLR